MPVRRMYVLVAGLPDDAAVWRPDKPSWTTRDELAAMQAELLDQVGRRIVFWLQLIAAPQYRGIKAAMPDGLLSPIEHPGRAAKTPQKTRRRRMTVQEMKRFFGGRR